MEIVIKFKNWILEFLLTARFGLIATSLLCSHPLTLCLTLILLAASIGALSGLVFIKWIFYAVILIFLGGIIVVFIYITTLAGNEKFHITLLNPWILVFIVRGGLIYFYAPKLSQFKKELFISHIYFSRATPFLWFLVIFLFRTLIIVIKLAENFKGTLIKFL
jgi:NADH-ubiquinone oxidoreductase chain 6